MKMLKPASAATRGVSAAGNSNVQVTEGGGGTQDVRRAVAIAAGTSRRAIKEASSVWPRERGTGGPSWPGRANGIREPDVDQDQSTPARTLSSTPVTDLVLPSATAGTGLISAHLRDVPAQRPTSVVAIALGRVGGEHARQHATER